MDRAVAMLGEDNGGIQEVEERAIFCDAFVLETPTTDIGNKLLEPDPGVVNRRNTDEGPFRKTTPIPNLGRVVSHSGGHSDPQ